MLLDEWARTYNAEWYVIYGVTIMLYNCIVCGIFVNHLNIMLYDGMILFITECLVLNIIGINGCINHVPRITCINLNSRDINRHTIDSTGALSIIWENDHVHIIHITWLHTTKVIALDVHVFHVYSVPILKTFSHYIISRVNSFNELSSVPQVVHIDIVSHENSRNFRERNRDTPHNKVSI